ncbi:helix-turn-helix domain-containing protein [Rhizobium giardinii]|uniref:helix-turn-helix domain-containing protein n=1 Tax=Rhizobium giardinii TaxID=56731 RepID=UPI0039DFCD0B
MMTDEARLLAEQLDRIEAKVDRLMAERAPVQSVDQTDTVSMLRMECAERGMILTADGRIVEDDAAALLGKAPQTLANWRAEKRPLPFSKIGRTVTYHLQDLAAFLDGAKKIDD